MKKPTMQGDLLDDSLPALQELQQHPHWVLWRSSTSLPVTRNTPPAAPASMSMSREPCPTAFTKKCLALHTHRRLSRPTPQGGTSSSPASMCQVHRRRLKTELQLWRCSMNGSLHLNRQKTRSRSNSRSIPTFHALLMNYSLRKPDMRKTENTSGHCGTAIPLTTSPPPKPMPPCAPWWPSGPARMPSAWIACSDSPHFIGLRSGIEPPEMGNLRRGYHRAM